MMMVVELVHAGSNGGDGGSRGSSAGGVGDGGGYGGDIDSGSRGDSAGSYGGETTMGTEGRKALSSNLAPRHWEGGLEVTFRTSGLSNNQQSFPLRKRMVVGDCVDDGDGRHSDGGDGGGDTWQC